MSVYNWKPEAVRVKLLGGFKVSVGSWTVDQDAWRLRKAASLVKLLALAPGHHLHREQVMDLLWPDLGRKAASNNLRQSLHALRKTLATSPTEGSSYLLSEDEQLVLCPMGQLWVDVEAFEAAAATARRAQEPVAYRAAIELYAGELLPGDRYQEWAEAPRRRLREMHLSLLLGLGRLREEHGEYDLAAEALRRALTEEPALEEAHAGLMRSYALAGSKGEALAQYGRLEEALSRELGTEPSASSRALREEISVGRFLPKYARPFGSPPEEPKGASKHNLPSARSSFVGREREMVEVKRDLAMTRLLTLTGAGGSGKTRLTLEVARELVGAYPDGVWLVELAGLSEGALVPQALAGALEVPERPGEPLADTLAEVLRSREVLLVLDNCEHLVEAVARLVDKMLDSCARVRILATSREALGVEGELRWAVPSLSVPEPQRAPSSEELEGYESVRLFVERARERDPAFSLGSRNARAVAEICRRLEGIPLALELAAARVGTLSIEQISERLGRSLELLTRGGRTAAPRQRTLKGALEWSYDLLSEAEQKVFRRLSTFAGGWTLEASEAVGSGDGVEESEVLDLLSSLVEKSLVVARGSDEGVVRYRLLEPIRQYALEKLKESAEAEEVRRRHAAFFLALAEDAEPRLRGPEDREWLERLETEHDNMRTALSWALERGEAELGLRLAGALWMFWDAHGYYGEGRRWLEAALARDGRASVAARLKALEAVFWLNFDPSGDHDRAEAVAQEAMELSDEAEIGSSLAASLRIMLAGPAWVGGDYERAKELLDESLALSREADDKVKIADALVQLAGTMGGLGDRARAKEILEEGIALCREVGYTYRLPDFLFSLGYQLLLEGDYERGAALNEEAAALCRERGYKRSLEYILDNLGWAALLQGDHERARISFEESLTLCIELGNKMIASESLEGLGCISAAEREAERAAKLFGTAEALRELVGSHHMAEEEALREPYLSMARSRLDEAAWQAAWAEGRAMSMEQAIEYALSEAEPTLPTSPAPKRPSSDEAPAALTRREREVAALVAQGLTNGQIAKELFISERTVDHHVQKILNKLELPSREQVASRLAE